MSKKNNFRKLGVIPFAAFLPAFGDCLTYCWHRVHAVYDNIYDTCRMSLHKQRTEEKKSAATSDIEGNREKNFTKINNKSKINRKAKIHFDSIWLIMILKLAFCIPCTGGGGAVAAFNNHSGMLDEFSPTGLPTITQVTKSVSPGPLSKPLAMVLTRPHGFQQIVGEKARQLLQQQSVDRGYDMCSAEVDNGPVVFKVSSNNNRDILYFNVDNHNVADCVINSRHGATVEKYKHQYNTTFQNKQCIFTLYYNGTRVIVNISSATHDLAEVLINDKTHQRCNDTSHRIFIIKASHGAQEVDPDADVPLNRSTEIVTDTNEKESEMQDNGLQAWAFVLIVIAVILIVAILIAVIVWNHVKKKDSHGAEEVQPEESTLMDTSTETERETNASHGAEVVDQGEVVPLNRSTETVTETNGAYVSNGDVPNTGADVSNGDVPNTGANVSNGDVPNTGANVSNCDVPNTGADVSNGDVPNTGADVSNGDVPNTGADVSNGDVPYTGAVADEANNDSEGILPETGITSGLVARRVEQFS